MRLGLHQPYFFPYLAYYQLLFAVDRFVAYDDVAWIKGGWINRNRLLAGHRAAYFTIPARGASPHIAIDMVETAEGNWRTKMLRTCEQGYARAPYRQPVLELLERVLSRSSGLVADLSVASLEAVRDYLGYSTPICRARNRYAGSAARGQERVIEICRAEGATEYLNAIGGSSLYSRDTFRGAGIALRFLKSSVPPMPDNGPISRPISGLSILDTLMRFPIEQVRALLAAYELV